MELGVADDQGPLDGARDPERDGPGGDRVQEDGELVAADAGDDVVPAHALADATGDLLQDGVARRVAVGVVDGLEVVEIHEQHRPLLLVADRRELLVQAAEVAETGDRVGRGLIAQHAGAAAIVEGLGRDVREGEEGAVLERGEAAGVGAPRQDHVPQAQAGRGDRRRQLERAPGSGGDPRAR